MHAIVRFVRLDLRSLRPSAKYMLIPVVIVVAPVLLLSGLLFVPAYLYLGIPALSSLAAVSAPKSLFNTDAHSRLDTLYTALGFQRRHVVAGRYATCLLLLILLTIAGVLLTAVAVPAFGAVFDRGVALAFATGSIALVGTLIAAQLPAFFATSAGPVRAVTAIPPALIVSVLFGVWAIPDARAALLPWLADANLIGLALAAIAVVGGVARGSPPRAPPRVPARGREVPARAPVVPGGGGRGVV